MIKISHLTKAYGQKKVLDDVSFIVNDGEVLGFLGPNGAGKTTTMNIITGYISSTSGTVEVDGFNILEDPTEIKKRIGYLPEQPPLYPEMVVYDYLKFVYDLKKVKKHNKEKYIQSIIDEVSIDGVKKRKIGNLSKGYRQRVGLAGALIGDPTVLILDEPTVGLDPKQIIEIRNLVKKLGEKRTVMLSSHILSEISTVCERVVIINNGKIVAEDAPNNLTERIGDNNMLLLRAAGKVDEVADILNGMENLVSVKLLQQNKEGSCDFELKTEGEANIEFYKKLFFTFAEKGIAIIMLKQTENSLEDIFLRLTADEGTASREEREDTDNASNNEAGV